MKKKKNHDHHTRTAVDTPHNSSTHKRDLSHKCCLKATSVCVLGGASENKTEAPWCVAVSFNTHKVSSHCCVALPLGTPVNPKQATDAEFELQAEKKINKAKNEGAKR